MTPTLQPSPADTARNNDSLRVIVTGGGCDWRGSLSQFIKDNRSRLTTSEIETLPIVIGQGGVYFAGGFKVSPVPGGAS